MELNEFQHDALTEIVNIGVGQAASVLNDMLESHVTLRAPQIHVYSPADAKDGNKKFGDEPLSSVMMGFNGSLAGKISLIFPPESALKLVLLLTGEDQDSTDLDSLKTGTLNEVGNILLNGVMGAIANTLDSHIDFTIPIYTENTISNIIIDEAPRDGAIVLATVMFNVKAHKIEGDILILFEVDSLSSLLNALDHSNCKS